MKITKMKKKVLIFSIALAMVMTTTSFAMPHIHGESEKGKVEAKEVLNTRNAAIAPKKALLMNTGKVTGRDASNQSDSKEIAASDYSTITDLMVDESVLEVAAELFNGMKNLTTLTFKSVATSKVKKIGMNAFKGTGITSVELPKDLTMIDESAFANTAALTTVSFTNSKNIENIKRGAFENSGLTTVDFSPMDAGTQALLNVGFDVFKGNKNLTTVTLSKKLNDIFSGTFANTKITSIDLPEKMISVSTYAFQGTPLANITVDSANTQLKVEANVLYNGDKTSLFLYPEGKKDKEFTILDSVKRIGANAFQSSPYLTAVVVGSNLESIDEYAFINTKKLTTLDVRKAKKIKEVYRGAFQGSALSSMLISKNTGPLTTITPSAFSSDAIFRKVSFLDDTGKAITGEELTELRTKYKPLNNVDAGSWLLEDNFPMPKATVDYDSMSLKGLVAGAQYTIEAKDYTADKGGYIPLVREWSGKTISIVQKAISGQNASEAQKLKMDIFYAVSIDGKESVVKKDGVPVTIQAPVKEGHVFVQWTTSDVTLPTPNQKEITFTMPKKDVALITSYKKVITTRPEDMVYDGTNEVTVRFDIPMVEFQDVMYNEKKLVKNVDYSVTSGSTILTFKKSFLDSMQGDINQLKAVFVNDTVTFSIKRNIPVPPTGTPNKPNTVKPASTRPNTGDTTNMFLLVTLLLASIGTVVVVKKRNKQINLRK